MALGKRSPFERKAKGSEDQCPCKRPNQGKGRTGQIPRDVEAVKSSSCEDQIRSSEEVYVMKAEMKVGAERRTSCGRKRVRMGRVRALPVAGFSLSPRSLAELRP